MRTLFPAACFTVFLALAGIANAQPKLAKPPRSGVSQCKSRCSVQYDFCKKHATTKGASKACSAVKKGCKGNCGA